jgi:hypothetical protein
VEKNLKVWLLKKNLVNIIILCSVFSINNTKLLVFGG